MTPLRFEDGLPFITATLHANGKQITLTKILVDTGSAGTLIDTDDLRALGVVITPADPIRFVTGVGGSEPYVEKQIDGIEIDGKITGPMIIEAGSVRYGIHIDAILGSDFLRLAHAMIDFDLNVLRL